jgi:hypothetical protein
MLAPTSVATASEQRRSRDWFAFGGEISGSYGSEDDGHFNDTEYERNTLQLLRITFSLEVKPTERFTFLTELRSDNFDAVRAYALFLRIHPWLSRSFDVQIGRIPPVFGAFSRRRYDSDNPLIGYPLGYQYLTPVRSDAAPRTTEELLAQRGHGTFTSYSLGESAPRSGLPVVDPLRWDTGIQARLGSRPVELSVAVTQGTLSNPRVDDDNGEKQIAGRLALRPMASIVLGLSAARGSYLSDALKDALPGNSGRAVHQRALGVDFEYSRGYWLFRTEGIWSEWGVPLELQPELSESMSTWTITAEGSYTLFPGFHAAARIDHMAFSRLNDAVGSATWDAPVSRLEAGVGYAVARNLLIKGSYQYNWRDGGPISSEGLVAAQVSYWFWR